VTNAHEQRAPISRGDADPRVESGKGGSRRRKRRLRRKLRSVARVLVAWFGHPLLRILSATWRMTVVGSENLDSAVRKDRGAFVALWHRRILLGLSHHRSRGWHALISASQDGDLPSAVLERFGYGVVRGSASRGGAGAVREMLTALGRGSVLVITPDGPRGPLHTMHGGLAWMARATGNPILPVGFACDRAWYARSWDRFVIPRPWARVVMVYEQPIRVDASVEDSELAAASERIREALLRAERRGFELLDMEPDW
jgi:lysophospholipid acyltransferase (LPLAT)-like uncharacterized protein